MSEMYSKLENVLKQNNYINSAQQFVAELQSDPAYAARLAGLSEADLIDEIYKIVPQYFAALDTPVDPTQTQGTATAPQQVAAPLSSEQELATRSYLAATLSEREEMTNKSQLVAVLIDKPYPGEWMKDCGKLVVKDGKEEALKKIDDQIHADKTFAQVLADMQGSALKKFEDKAAKQQAGQKTVTPTASVTFIPTNAQLNEMMAIKKAQPRKPGSTSDPVWFNYDNDKAVAQIREVLASGSGTFLPYIAPLEDTGEGAEKNKAWRWATKGYVVRKPHNEKGVETVGEEYMTPKQLTGFMAVHCLGVIPSRGESALSAALRSKKNKSATTSAGTATQDTVALTVKGNSPKDKPELRCINEISVGAHKEMNVRSKDFYWACTVRYNKNAKKPEDMYSWTVKKVRLTLKWMNAPMFIRSAEYATFLPTKNANGGIAMPSKVELELLDQRSQAFVAQVLNGDAAAVAEYGIGTVLTEIKDTAAKEEARANSEVAAALAL